MEDFQELLSPGPYSINCSSGEGCFAIIAIGIYQESEGPRAKVYATCPARSQSLVVCYQIGEAYKKDQGFLK